MSTTYVIHTESGESEWDDRPATPEQIAASFAESNPTGFIAIDPDDGRVIPFGKFGFDSALYVWIDV